MSKHTSTFALLVFILYFLLSCQPDNPIDGIWKQKGFGRIITIDKGEITIYSRTEDYCGILSTGGKLDEHFKVVRTDKKELVLDYGSTRNYYFTRIDKLPAECGSRKENSDIDPVKNFDVFWNFFNENYAFFEKRGIDWNDVKDKYTRQVKQVKSQREFYLILKNILDSLKDGHVKINLPDSIAMPNNPNSGFNFEQVKLEIPDSILRKYVNSPKTYNFKTISWGKLKNTNTGYIVVPKMFGFSNYGLSEQGFNNKLNEVFAADPGPGYMYYQDESKGVDFVMKEIYKDLSKTDSIIIDLRFNEGGLSSPSLQILKHFTNRTYKAHTRTITKNIDEPLVQDYFIEPAKKNIFKQKVCLLTSHWSASASESFVISSLENSNFSRYGSQTAGIISEIVWVVLPNGWELSISVEVISDPRGNEYEVTGVPVDFKVNYSKDVTEFYNSFYQSGKFSDPLIEYFLK